MKVSADLQIHTKYSDGFFEPEELIQKAHSYGLTGISFTDHNYLLPLEILEDIELKTKNVGIIFIEGVEISSTSEGVDFHLLAYSRRFKRTVAFQELLASVHKGYDDRGRKIVKELSSQEYEVTEGDLSNSFYTYLHKNLIARIVHEKYNIPLDHVKKMKLLEGVQMAPFSEVSDIVTDCNGVTVLAHPGGIYKNMSPDEFETFLRKLIAQGLNGFELSHYKNTDDTMIGILHKLAQEYDLLLTGGSDYHSDQDSVARIGEYGMGREEFEHFYQKLP